MDEIWGTFSILFAAGSGTFWARSAQKRERETGAKFCFFFVRKGTRDIIDFPSHKSWIGEVVNPFGTEFFENLPARRLFSKRQILRKNLQQLATSGCYNSLTI